MKISVITTTYNRKDYLKETIESVQKSVFAPLKEITFEHIIYDDGSTDGTPDFFATTKYPGVQYIRSEKNKGPSYGRNRAIEQASGDYIFLLDSDDIVLQRALYNFAESALAHPETQWFISDFLRVEKNLSYAVGNDYYGWKFEDPRSMLQSIFKGEFFIQSNVFFKKSLFEKAGRFDESLHMAEDLDLYIRFLLQDAMPHYSAFVSHLHRIHDTNLSAGANLENHKELVKTFEEKYKNLL